MVCGKFRKASRVPAGICGFRLLLCPVDDEDYLPDPELPGERRRFPGHRDCVIRVVRHDNRTGEPFGNGPPEMFETGRRVKNDDIILEEDYVPEESRKAG